MTPGHEPQGFVEIFLQPGEFHFSGRDTRLRTLLGSCVSITLWHPERRLGGMCHFLLPTRVQGDAHALEGRYGDEALFLLLREARHQGCRPRDLQYKVFGGARMTDRDAPAGEQCDVGWRNVRKALEMLDDLGVQPLRQDVGGQCARAIMLDNWSGDVWVRNVVDGDFLASRAEAKRA